MNKAIAGAMLTFLLVSTFVATFNIRTVKAEAGTVYIRADGSIDPPTTPIASVDNVTYTFTDDINDSIVVERNDIIIDGNRCILQGSGLEKGVSISNVYNVTIKNLSITGFDYGLYFNATSYNVFFENNVFNNYVGVWFESALNNVLFENNITDNGASGLGYGIWLNSSSNNTIQENNITNNQYGGVWIDSSSDNVVCKNIITNNKYGVCLLHSLSSNITDNYIANHHWNGVRLEYSSYNTVSGNNITDSGWSSGNGGGLWLYSSTVNEISNNDVSNNYVGMMFEESSSNNTVSGNDVTANAHGISLLSIGNILRNNSMVGNLYNFRGKGMQDVNVSNKVDGKPIYYLVDCQNTEVPSDAGYVALVNCSRITVKNLNLTKNGEGLYLFASWNNSIFGNYITDNYQGINIESSSSNDIFANNIANNSWGIHLHWRSNYNIVSRNNITNNVDCGVLLIESDNNFLVENNVTDNDSYGFLLGDCCNNTFCENTVMNSYRGIEFQYAHSNIFFGNIIRDNYIGIQLYDKRSSSNKFCHNNFHNYIQVNIFEGPCTNFWSDDYPSGGNYWSDYTGVDFDHDGIGDSPQILDDNNIDHFPLMGPFNKFNTSLGYHVNVISNSTISSFEYSESNNVIKMYVSNMTVDQTFGFCRICIPKDLISPDYHVEINDGAVEVLYFNNSIYDNGTHRWIYFAYEHSTHEVIIVPETNTFTIWLLALLSLSALIFRKSVKHLHKP